MEYAIPDELVREGDGWAEAPLPLFDAPPTQDELFARLRLSRSRRVGPATFRRLIAEHGTAVAALAALPAVAANAGDTKYQPASEADIRREITAARRTDAKLLTLGAPGYPARLADVADAPPVLWAQGQTAMLGRRSVAIVGTRNASSLALRMARALGRDLADAGVVVVSGLARGVDAVAHSAALEGGTVAVHAGGLDQVYPAENTELAAKIAEQGCALSERPFGLSPQARDFPRRNRIVSGLSMAVVVVEAAARSGSMITARDALDQGREVLAVPGHPLDGRASGCNLLLRDGATLVRDADDILEALEGLDPEPTAEPALPDTSQTAHGAPSASPDADPNLRKRILDLLSPVPVPEDQLMRDLLQDGPAPTQSVAAHLSELELSGCVARKPGGGLVKV
ncbi:DNA processing protein DprA [Jannaschia pagri]|uniref:DNA processing protein DprA n=1 Tax=Jannaschia pagri TaxID=2829797 RepID=A0ABQ4NKZ3_9RHOB|nr:MULTISPECIES: DNA-processing protein DprA [unclassified Jannaschia]GIT91042.1 DNA processing protein DprA [Jannaschia sp. AI_61]GIT94874.1 DNA processing protein DprA [Jannaschia sp. AI_62]